MRPANGLGDLLRAWAAVGYAEAQLRPLAALLGLDPIAAAASDDVASARIVAGTGAIRVPPPTVTGTGTVGGVAGEPRAVTPATSAETGAATVVEPLPPQPPRRPAWTAAGQRLAAGKRFVPQPTKPLFRVERERALLAAAAGRARPEGDIDVPRLVDVLARGARMRGLPRRMLVSPRGGVQLLLDRSDWMAPFAADVDRLERRMRTVAGPALDVCTVDDAPPLVRFGDADAAPAPWRPPPPGATLVVVSDLGRAARRAGRRGLEAAWRALLDAAQRLELDPLVVVPGQISHYAALDAALRRSLFLGWDTRARVASIMQFRRTRRR